MSDRYELNFQGHRVLIISSHKEAVEALNAAGFPCPTIPTGCNTAIFRFTSAGGARALAVNQKGFQRITADDEQEVNGCMVFVLGESLGKAMLDDSILDAVHNHILQI